jgi:hypothetical protein
MGMRSTGIAAAVGIAIAMAALGDGALAAYREPKGVFALFPRGLVKRIAMPGRTEGYMFKTFRQPVFVAGKERSHLAIITNGVDHKTWSFEAILATLLRNFCGIRDGTFGPQLIKKAYAAAPIGRAAVGSGAGAKDKPLRRQSAVSSACKVTVEIEGSRWRKVTATFEPAE